MHKYYVNKIIDSKDPEKNKQLGNLFIETIDFVKGKDENEYEDIECVLYEISEGRVLNEEKAEKIIKNMKPYRNEMDFIRYRRCKKTIWVFNYSPN